MKRLSILVCLLFLLGGTAYAQLGGSGISGGGGTTTVATDTLWDAAGDLAYGTGANTGGRLAKGTGYQILTMKSDASMFEWSSTLTLSAFDMTSGTSSVPWPVGTAAAPTTEGQAYWNSTTDTFTIGTGTVAQAFQVYDADLTTYAGITPSANVQSLLGAADYPAMKVLLDLEIGTDVQAYDAQLDTLSTGGANNTLFGINGAGEYGYYANHSHDDSAAQFTSATASKGTMKNVQSSISDGVLLSNTPVVTGNATITTPSLAEGTYTQVFAETANTIGNGGTTNQKLVIREDTTDGAWTGIGLYRTCLAATAIGAPVYIDSAGKAVAANAAAAATMPAIGINVTTTAEANQPCYIVTHGTVTQDTWTWTAGNTIYVDDSAAGVLTATIGDVSGTDHVVQIIGIALSDDTILVQPTLATITLE